MRRNLFVACAAWFILMGVVTFPGMPEMVSWVLIVTVLFPGVMWWLWYTTK